MEFFATTPKDLEGLLAEELRSLGAGDVRETRAGAAFSGRLEAAYRACLWSRLASRVLLPLAVFPAPDAEALYRGAKAIPWPEHLTPFKSIAVDFTGVSEAISHSHFGALKVKDAVADRMREELGRRPDVDTRRPDIRINAHLRAGKVTIGLDLSGDSLHRRGYRGEAGEAPLKENLASAILLRAGWPDLAREGAPLLDPMCGSGTFLAEAALMAGDIAPGLLRPAFGFLGWKGHDRKLWQGLLDEAERRRKEGEGRIPPLFGYDADPKALEGASANLRRAGAYRFARLEKRDLERMAPPRGLLRPGLLVTNPPYGERMGKGEDLPALYALLGRRLREQFPGWSAAVFTGSPEHGKGMGLRARKVYHLFNGAIPCQLLLFTVAQKWFVDKPRPGLPGHGEEEKKKEKGEKGKETPDRAGSFANRLRKCLRVVGRWAEREGIACYRLYDADLPEYNVAVDVYERWAHISEYEAPRSVDPAKARERLTGALKAVSGVLGVPPERVFLKVRRRQKGPTQYEKLGAQCAFHRVHEGGLSFLVNFTDYLDTGLFLDHRPIRARIRELAKGKRFLNLFCYTGAATVYAASGGAAATTSVDMSNTYLDWARRNLDLNGMKPGRNLLIQADITAWIKAEKGKYDLIFLDPPVFSHSKRMEGTFDVQRDHVWLLRSTARLLAPGGLIIFSNPLRTFRMDTEGLGGLSALDITDQTIPRDFARNRRIHNCWIVTR